MLLWRWPELQVTGLLLCVLAEQDLCFSTLSPSRFLPEADLSGMEGIHSGYQGVLRGLEVDHGGHRVSENETSEVINISVASQQGGKPRVLQKPAMLADEVSNEICQPQRI